MIRDFTRCNVSSDLSHNFSMGYIFKQQVSIDCSIEILREKLQDGCYSAQWLDDALQRCGNHCEK